MKNNYNITSVESLFEKMPLMISDNLQIKKGLFSSTLLEIEIDRNIIHHVSTSSAISSEGVSPKEFYMFIIFDSIEKQVFMNCTLDNNSIIVLEPLSEYYAHILGPHSALIIYIPKETIKMSFANLTTGVYKTESKKVFNEIFLLSRVLSKPCTINRKLIQYYSNLIIYKMRLCLLMIDRKHTENRQSIMFYKISNFMKKEYKENLEIKEISEYFQIPERTLHYLFFQQIGLSPKEYQKVIQMNYLKQEIIKNSNLTISNIMSNQGMSSQSYITKKFKLHFHMTPNEFKKRYF